MKSFLKPILGLAFAAFPIMAQVNQAEFSTMTWSWSNPITWLATCNLGTSGAGYYQDYSPSMNYTGTATDWRKWRFVAYVGLTGKKVTAWGNWGQPSIPSPVVRPDGRIGDNCQHAHLSYGVWLQYGYYSGGVYYSGVVGPLQGGTKSGIRVNNYTCRHSVNNSLNQIDPRFGWGSDVFNFTFPKTGNIWNMMIVGASALSHGAFGCSTHGCVNQPWIGAYGISY
jgi:hypothetical protein